jgi:hypothetical protein
MHYGACEVVRGAQQTPNEAEADPLQFRPCSSGDNMNINNSREGIVAVKETRLR